MPSERVSISLLISYPWRGRCSIKDSMSSSALPFFNSPLTCLLYICCIAIYSATTWYCLSTSVVAHAVGEVGWTHLLNSAPNYGPAGSYAVRLQVDEKRPIRGCGSIVRDADYTLVWIRKRCAVSEE